MRLRKEPDTMQEQEVLLIAEVSDAFAHPARIKMFRYIMKCIRERTPVCNKDLIAEFGYAQATTSQHIKKLVDAKLLETRKSDKFTYLYANLGMVQQYVNAVRKFD